MMRNPLMTAGALVLAGAFVAACDFGEERPFNYKKGEYLGPSHQPLDDATLAALRARTIYQSDLGQSGPDLPSSVSAPASVRPPGTPR